MGLSHSPRKVAPTELTGDEIASMVARGHQIRAEALKSGFESLVLTVKSTLSSHDDRSTQDLSDDDFARGSA